MSETRAKVVEFDLDKHPNADLLSLAKIRDTGWQCVVKTSDFQDTNIGVYIPIDAEVPVDTDTFKFLDKGKGKPHRVKTVRLRGALSQGLLIKAPVGSNIGDDLTDHFGVKRYEPPIPVQLAGDMVRCPGNFLKYASAENFKNYPSLLVEGENVRCTEKQHGSSFRAGYIHDGKFDNEKLILEYIVGSHKTAKEKDGNNYYSVIARELDIENKLKSFMDENDIDPKINFIIYGELIGDGVQNLTYGCAKNERKVVLFDVVLDDKYQPWEFVEKIARYIGIDTVPLLYRGPYSISKAMELRDGVTVYGNGVHIREGIVITSEPERFDMRVGRVTVKMISDDYLEMQGKNPKATDFH